MTRKTTRAAITKELIPAIVTIKLIDTAGPGKAGNRIKIEVATQEVIVTAASHNIIVVTAGKVIITGATIYIIITGIAVYSVITATTK